ncbi:hypothetical protein KKE14_01715 [Patescibacteria group bacterium]|nr:hypothetical protein [Patescibacteria group bacterium]
MEDGLNREIIEQKAEAIRRASKPKTMGVLIVIFVCILIVMVGSLASYYYYTFQKQGTTSEQNIRNSWNDVVVATVELTNSFTSVTTFSDLSTDTSGGFKGKLSSASRALRDVVYDFQGENSYVFSGHSFVNRLNSFLDDYLAYLRELQKVIDNGASGMIKDIADIDELMKLSKKMNESYDNLLISDKNGVVQANLPRELFEMSDSVKILIEADLLNRKETEEADKAAIDAAVAVVTKFVQAYSDKDAEAMKIYLTSQAESEFKPAQVLDNALEIKNFKAIDTRKLNETKIEIDGQIDKETPDSKTITEKRLFAMLKVDGKWLIDSWDIM